ncbi:MAG: hydantoinase B/oxoprolinase family protein [Alphaproteobacteria bacterium]|jgi:N-methylhydantoinase B|nr:hydantoinase B/oxoprolinase family protein [Alphaproteobacteria bacterium]
MSDAPSTDTITLELINGTLRAARVEMEALIDRTAMSPFIREKKDYFTAFLNRDGKLVVSTSLTLSGNLVEGIFKHYPSQTMADGDLYIYNDAYGTGGGVSHLPDMVFVAPVFHDGELFAFAEAWGHLWDIGGMVPGSISPQATSTFQEGILIPPVKVMAGGELNEEVFRIFTRNSRFPDMMRGDLKAIMAACHLGKRRLEEAVARFGLTAVTDAFEFMLSQSEQALRAEIERRVPDGAFGFRDFIDSDAVTDESHSVHVTLRKADGKVGLDFSESDDQALGPINFIMDDSVPKYMCGLYLTMHDPNIQMNAGFERAIDEIVTRPGSIVDPVEPAPLGLRSHTMIRVNTALFGALAEATGGDASAASCVYVLYYLRSQDRASGRDDLCIEGLAVGFGARTYADGIDAVYYVAQKNYSLEFAEMEFSVEIEAFRIHADSGGPGRWRGGCGIVRDVRVLADEATLGLRLDNCKHPAFGVNGGHSGRAGRVLVNPGTAEERELKTMSDGTPLEKGDLIRIITPGGGGWGSPLERPAEAVRDDVLDGFVSPESAFADYGAVLAADGISLDLAATDKRRAEIAGPTGMFHRRSYFDAAAT